MNRKLKILQILPELNAGGVERGTLEFARFLVESGHESLVLSNGGVMQETLEEEGTRHITMPIHKKSLLSFRYVWKIRSLLLKEKFDVIHIRSRMPAWLVYTAWKLVPENKRPRLVSTFHGFYSVNAYSNIMAKGEAIICVSRSVRNYVLENYPSTRKRVLNVIHRGVDLKEFPYDFQADPEWLNKWKNEGHYFKDKFVITLPGRITSWKGHGNFLEILYYLKRDNIPVHGLIIGDVHSKKEEYFTKLVNSINKLGLSNDVTLLPHRTDLREIMTISDLVVSCSTISEAFGRVTLEALSLGVPVIAYSHGGVKEQLEALYPYGIIEPNKKSSMRLGIREFYKLKEKPKPLMNTNFTLEKTNNRILSVYKRLLSN
jgi:glycosyltransferase involved in cell wall biosynthesis